MVVHDLDALGASSSPAKANAILIVDADAVLARTIAFEHLEAVSRRDPQVVEPTGDRELPELPPRDRLDSDETLHSPSAGEGFRVGIPVRGDHVGIVTLRVHNGKRVYHPHRVLDGGPNPPLRHSLPLAVWPGSRRPREALSRIAACVRATSTAASGTTIRATCKRPASGGGSAACL